MQLATLHPITRSQFLTVAVIIALTFGLVLALGLEIPPPDIWSPLWFCGLLGVVYSSVFPQIILVVDVLGFATDRRMDLFMLRFMLAGLITCGLFAFFPTEGSCVRFHLPTPPHYVGILNELHRLRNGVATV